MHIFLRNILIYICFFTTLKANVSVHPFYVGVSEIEYDQSDSTIKVSIRLFTDDLQKYFIEEGHFLTQIQPNLQQIIFIVISKRTSK